MPSKFLVPLEVPNYQGVPVTSTADTGYVLTYIKYGWWTKHDGTVETDLVLQRPLDGFTEVDRYANPVTASDTVLSAIEKIQRSLSTLKLVGDVTGNAQYVGGELIIQTTGGGIDCTALVNCQVIIDIQGNLTTLDQRITDLENAPAQPFLATEFDNYHFSGYGTAYATGDVVYYQGRIYQALANNDGVTPVVGGNVYWADLGTGARLRQIVSDWNATTGEAQILNKPTTLSQFTNDVGFITGYTETDPIFSASVAAGITSTDVSNWNDAYSWGNHALAGYLTAETDTLDSVTGRGNSTNNDIYLGGSLLINTSVNAGFRLDVAGYARIFDPGGASVEIYPTPGTYTAFRAAPGSGAGPTIEFFGDTGTSLNGVGIYGPDPNYQGMLVYAMTGGVEDIVFLSSLKVALPKTQLLVWTQSSNALDTPTAGIGSSTIGRLEINDGTAGNYADLILNHLTATSLAGSGTRMVVADDYGVLGTQSIPTGTYTGDNGISITVADIVQLGSDTNTGSPFTTDRYINTGSSDLIIQGASNRQSVRIENTGAGYAFTAYSSGVPAALSRTPTSTNTVETVITLARSTTGTPANGIGQAMQFMLAIPGGFMAVSGQLINRLTTVSASPTSEYVFSLVNAGTTNDVLQLAGNGQVRFHKYGLGTFTGTSTYYLAVDSTGKVIEVTAPTGGGSGTVTSVGLATGTSGSDVNVSNSPITNSGTITLNIPDASTSARGVITTSTQSIAGRKTFVNQHAINVIDTTLANGFYGSFVSTRYNAAASTSNVNLYGERNSLTLNMGGNSISGTETFNVAAQHNEVYISGAAGSNQPVRAMMTALVGLSGSAAMDIKDFRFIEIKSPDASGVTGHVVTTIHGLYIANMATASNFSVSTAYAIRQMGTLDINQFNGPVEFKNYANGVSNILTLNGTGSVGVQALSTLQSTLVSGTNIQTINGNSILGSGNELIFEDDRAKYGFEYFNDFLAAPLTTGTTDGKGLHAIFSGTGTAILPSAAPSVRATNQQGFVQFATGSSAAGFAGIFANNTASNFFITGGGEMVFTTFVYLPTLSTSTERFRLVIGFGNVTGVTAETNGAFFTYDEGATLNGTSASGNWQCVTVANSVRTLITTTTTVGTSAWVKLSVVINASATQVQFLIDNVVAATHTTNIPTGTTQTIQPKMQMVKTVGTTTRSLYVDYFGYKQTYTTPKA